VPRAAEAADSGRAAPTIVDLIEAGAVDMVINTPRGRGARADGYEIRRVALRRGVPTMTTIAAAHAAVQAIEVVRDGEPAVICLQELHQSS
jgi:carbamoyl-phosphate synthase large subunit